MGGDAPTSGISFDIIKEVQENDSNWEKIYAHTYNWIETNKKGMAFGLFFAATLILLFSSVKDKQYENPWLNSFIGLIMGAPLGVCVNCATPIAKGITDSGGKTETALATMISSPTFNVIVLSMLFALFPDYMILLKIVLSLLLILIAIPLLVKWFSPKLMLQSSPLSRLSSTHFPFNTREFTQNQGWIDALQWLTFNYVRSFWFIFKTAVPLMLLAGLLGNIFIVLLPFEELVSLVSPGHGRMYQLMMMAIVAAIGVFLPVPMAFDVIIVAILMNLGLPAGYCMALLFTLGVFSIYPFFIIFKHISRPIAIALTIVVIGMGVVAGVVAHKWSAFVIEKSLLDNYKKASVATFDDFWKISASGGEARKFQNSSILRQNQFHTWSTFDHNIRVERKKYLSREEAQGRKWFEIIEGPELGISVPYKYSAKYLLEPYANQRSIAAGDIQKDGFADLLVVSADSLYIYQNKAGQGFEKNHLHFAKPDLLNAALVDLNDDGWLDILTCSFMGGVQILYSDKGSFSQDMTEELPIDSGTVLTMSLALGDLNGDGRIDVFLGNWHGTITSRYSSQRSKNYGFYNTEGGWVRFELNSLPGETLSVSFTDYNNDGTTDIVEENDFQVSDYYHTGDINGDYNVITVSDSVLAYTTATTMSIVSTDINNDLIPEIYSVQTFSMGAKINNKISDACASIVDNTERANCISILNHRKKIVKASRKKSVSYCPDKDFVGCMAILMTKQQRKLRRVIGDGSGGLTSLFPRDGDFFEFYQSQFDPSSHEKVQSPKADDPAKRDALPGRIEDAVLFVRDASGKYLDRAEEVGLNKTGWAWNARFGDLDNDGWQDVFIANGYLWPPINFQSNILYKNKNGITFEDVTEKNDLENYIPAASYTYLDFDLDGDLDIFLATSLGPIFVYKNNTPPQKRSLIIEIEDHIGNHFGIGSKVFIFYGNGKKQYRELVLSGGYKSFDEPIAHFGLGDHEWIERIEIHWSTGEKTKLNQRFQTGYRYKIVRFDAH